MFSKPSGGQTHGLFDSEQTRSSVFNKNWSATRWQMASIADDGDDRIGWNPHPQSQRLQGTQPPQQTQLHPLPKTVPSSTGIKDL
jgi:hypothetical protein